MDIFSLLITRPMGYIIEFVYTLIPNYGVAIILFTLLIKALLFPLNYKSQKSIIRQQRLQPLLQEIQTKYANDKEKQSMETMKLYKENHVSLLGGCLPTLLQFPLIIGLYSVIRNPLTYVKNIDFKNTEMMDSAKVIVNSFPDMFKNMTADSVVNNYQIPLAKAGEMLVQSPDKLAMLNDISVNADQVMNVAGKFAIDFNFLGIDLSMVPSSIVSMFSGGQINWSLLSLLIIPALATFLTWFTSKLTKMMTPKKPDEKPKRVTGKEPEKKSGEGMMNAMNIMMPVTTLIFTFTLPSGIGLYWIMSSLVQIAQQFFMTKYLNKKDGGIIVGQQQQEQSNGGKKKRKKR
jgi:YidC/Oxa1 family membrane protein insertase